MLVIAIVEVYDVNVVMSIVISHDISDNTKVVIVTF